MLEGFEVGINYGHEKSSEAFACGENKGHCPAGTRPLQTIECCGISLKLVPFGSGVELVPFGSSVLQTLI